MPTATPTAFPPNWQIAQDYDPNEHTMQLKGKAYLDVQNRLIWFIRDQRNLIVSGLAKTNYVVHTEMVEHDKDAKWANFKTSVRDVLGNEATMYGSEAAKDFGDYLEKASTKSLGRALAMLGYGTQFAPEMDEGERVVDSPVERMRQQPPRTMPAADETRKVVTPQISKDRARLQAAPTSGTNITYTAEVSPTADNVDDLVKISLAQQISDLKRELGISPERYKNLVKTCQSNDEVLAKLQELADAKRDGFPLDGPARKAAQG